MPTEQYLYLVVENATDVCEGIIRRMSPFEKWKPLGYAVSVKEAISRIELYQPNLIFLDWSLAGGSAYEILQSIENNKDYDPYIIFNTGFQKDNPDIPQQIFNLYQVDKYLVKPFWETLRLQLPQFLAEAEVKANQLQRLHRKKSWLEAVSGEKIPVDLTTLKCICQHPTAARQRIYFFDNGHKEIHVQLQWQKCTDLLMENKIDFFITKSRGHLVCREYIEVYEKPFVRLRQFPAKIEVVKENIKRFEEWLFHG